MKKIRTAVIGAGNIAKEYIKILKKNNSFQIQCIIGRSLKNVENLSKNNLVKNFHNDIKKIFKYKLDVIIVAASILSTIKLAKQLKNFKGIILFEKPLGVNFQETKIIRKILKKNKNKCFIGLNRRFYKNIQFVKNFIIKKKDSSTRVVSVYDQENPYFSNHPKKVKQNWMFANSIHLLDLLNFFTRGYIKKIETEKKNIQKQKIIISKLHYSSGDIGLYTSIWNRPGPWAFTISSANYFFEFNPIERLKIRSMLNNRPVDLLFKEKRSFKPGFEDQLLAIKNFFFNKKIGDLLNIEGYFKLAKTIKKIYR
jgi:predicted dehydrogenase